MSEHRTRRSVAKHLPFKLAGLALLASCVTVQPPLSPKSTPAPGTGYVAGVFARNEGTNFGFGLLNTATQAEHVLAFGRSASAWQANDLDVTLIAVPPGEYRIEKWLTFGNVATDNTARPDFQKPVEPTTKLGKPFRVGEGQIVHLGSMTGTSSTRPTAKGIYKTWSIDPIPLTYPNAVAGVAAKYPAFSNQLVICLHCDPATGPQQPGLGTYDPKRLTEELGAAKAAVASLKAFMEPRQAQVAPLQEAYEKLRKARDAEQRSDFRLGIERQMDAKRTALNEQITKFNSEYDAERERLAKPFWAHVATLAEELRVERSLARVVSKNAEVWTGVDLTDELLERYEARWPAPAPAAPANAAPAP